jgi:hypothetical protein
MDSRLSRGAEHELIAYERGGNGDSGPTNDFT